MSMRVLHIIDDPKEVQKFVGNLDKINNAFKNIYEGNKTYSNLMGVITIGMNEAQIPQIVTAEVAEDYSTVSETVISTLLGYNFTIDHDEYFQFRKDKSDKMASIEIADDEYIKFEKESGVRLVIEHDTEIMDNYDLIYNKMESFVEVQSDIPIDRDSVEMMFNSGDSFLSKLIIDLENNTASFFSNLIKDKDAFDNDNPVISLTIAKKFLQGLEKRKLKGKEIFSDMTVSVSKNETGLTALAIKIINKSFTTEQIFIIIDINS